MNPKQPNDETLTKAEPLTKAHRKLIKVNKALKAKNARLSSQVTELQAQVVVAKANVELRDAYADKLQAQVDAANSQLQAKTDALSFHQGMLAKAEHDLAKCKKVVARRETDSRKLMKTATAPNPVEMHLSELITCLYIRLTSAGDIIAERDMEIEDLKSIIAKNDPGTIVTQLVAGKKVEIKGIGTLTLSEADDTGITVDFCLAKELRYKIESDSLIRIINSGD